MLPLSSCNRWLGTVKILKCKLSTSSANASTWRRMQVSDEQAQREKKSLLQKVAVFTAHAHELMVKDLRVRRIGLELHGVVVQSTLKPCARGVC